MSTTKRETEIAAALRDCGRQVAQAVVANLETCLTCAHFDEATETCALAKARPPARVIAYGCPQYLPDVPF